MDWVCVVVGAVVVVILSIAKITGALAQILGALSWLWGYAVICRLKRKKSWPIEVKRTQEPATIVYEAASGWYRITVQIMLRVRKPKPQSKIDSVSIELSGCGWQVVANEWGHSETTHAHLKATTLTGAKLAELVEGEYSLLFTQYDSRDAHIGKWAKSKEHYNVRGIIKLTAEGRDCEAIIEVVPRPLNSPS